MFNNNSSRSFVFAALVLSAVFSLTLSAGENNNLSIKANVTMIAEDGPFTDLEKNTMDSFIRALKENDAYCESDEGLNTEFLLDIKKIEVDETERIIISVLAMNVIPDEIVELGGKEEVFHLVMKKKSEEADITEEGWKIRQYISSEYMKQFRMIHMNYLELIDAGDIDKYCSELVTEYLGR